ncbi:MAG: hypothetical protein RIC18_05475 [Hoeflea sp.]|uniref:hypothetical protein n=1 Tax=Hoeflea sp. TaxID=1940281 RepID=UPI0032EAFF3A
MADDRDIIRKYLYTNILAALPEPPIKYKMPKRIFGMFEASHRAAPEKPDPNEEIKGIIPLRQV